MRRVFNFFKKLFDKKTTQSHADPSSLRDMDIFIFAAIEADGIGVNELTQEKLLEQVRRSTEELSKRREFWPFVYEVEGLRRLPFFTSQAYAEIFAGEYSRRRNRFYPFQLLEVKGSVIFDQLASCDVLVMNDGSPDAAEISVRQKNQV